MAPRPEKEPLTEGQVQTTDFSLDSPRLWRWYFWLHTAVILASCVISQVPHDKLGLPSEIAYPIFMTCGTFAVIGSLMIWAAPVLGLTWIVRGFFCDRFQLILHGVVAFVLTYVQFIALLPAVS